MKDYIYQVARIRVKETGLLRKADYEQLLSEPDLAAALRYLSDKGWGLSDAAPDAEAMLTAEEDALWSLMEELLHGSDELSVLRLPRDYQNLKAAIKQLYTASPLPPERLYEKGGTIDADLIRRAAAEQDFDLLPEIMRAPAKEATEVLSRTGNGQLCDMIIDKAALSALLEAGRTAPDPVLNEYAELTVAGADIRTALRFAAQGHDAAEIREQLTEAPGLDIKMLSEAAESGRGSVAEYLKTTPYEALSEPLSQSMRAFECACDNLMLKKMRSQLSESEHFGPIAAYVIARECEIKCVRMILTGKQHKLPESILRESLREAYV